MDKFKTLEKFKDVYIYISRLVVTDLGRKIFIYKESEDLEIQRDINIFTMILTDLAAY